jgi:hypothetical protein
VARGVAGQAFGKERVEPAVWQLGDDGLHGRPSDLGAEDSLTQRIAMPIQHGIDDRVAGNDLHMLTAWRG